MTLTPDTAILPSQGYLAGSFYRLIPRPLLWAKGRYSDILPISREKTAWRIDEAVLLCTFEPFLRHTCAYSYLFDTHTKVAYQQRS
jgi:hypothetical protein